jgi:hypothetical protein
MTTLNPSASSTPTVRRKLTGYPADNLRLDWAVALLSAVFALGVYLDGWAHNNIPNLIDTFFTPYHGLLYGGFFLVAGVLGFNLLRNMAAGYHWRTALPQGYMLGLLGVTIFLVGGVGDLLWHETFGFEDDVEALLSPTHLMLVAGAMFYVAIPLRAAWGRVGKAIAPTWREFFPALLSMTLILSLVTFFLQYATPARPNALLEAPPLGDEAFYQNASGIFNVLAPSLVVMGSILYLLRRWRLPTGSLFFLISVNYTLMFLMTMQDSFRAPLTLVAMILTGVVAELLYRWLQSTAERADALRWFAFLTPFAMISLYVVALLLTGGLWWEIHMWAGVPFLAGVAGLFLSFISQPPAVPEGQ